MREWLRNIRMEKKMTMKEVAEQLGISESYYCAIENGDRQKNMDVMLASGLSTIFKISVANIVNLEKDWMKATN
jgi:transcriptional regulator with XRE-family HTH domain